MTNSLAKLEFLVQALFRRRRDCPHCGSTDSRLVARKRIVIRVRRCNACELCFTDPSYETSLFGELYQRRYGAEGSTTELPDSERLAELLRTDFAGSDKDVRSRMQALRSLAPGPRLLELGSSWGYALFQAARAGFDARGVEISEPRRAFGQSELSVSIDGSLDASAGETFDCLYSAHTLEHFTELRGVFETLAERLEPGGLLVLEVPNFDLDARGPSALSTVGAVHPIGFTSGFFHRNLPRAGFSVRGIYERWEDVPDRPVQRSRTGEIIVLADRIPRSWREAA